MSRKLYISLILLIISGLLEACQSADSAAPPSGPKVWSSSEPTWNLTFDNPSVGKVRNAYTFGGVCVADYVKTWDFLTDSDKGTIIISNAAATETALGMADCSVINGTWTYAFLASEALELCNNTIPCIELH